jgi:nitrogen fixation NifU-like protein
MNEATDLQDLYRQTVLDHSRHPRNRRRIKDADAAAEGHNPLCGDKITVYVKREDDRIGDLAFEGIGCAISLASASIMTERLGHTSAEAARSETELVLRQFGTATQEAESLPGDMAALSGVRAYPSRTKCASLAWKTLLAALDGATQPITTEE